MRAKKITLITGHDYQSPHKTGFFFWADILQARGVDVRWITVGLSPLTFLKKNPRHYEKPFNVWIDIKQGLKKYTWCPLFHPVNFGNDLLNKITTPLFRLYPHLLPKSVMDEISGTDIFIVECGAGPMLVPSLKKHCPDARFIYSYSDRLNVVHFHPVIPEAEQRAVSLFNLIRTNAAIMNEDFPTHDNVRYIPQAIEKSLFDSPSSNPYTTEKNAISVGDMLFDAEAIETLAQQFPDWNFHLFGRQSKLEKILPNVHVHGEYPFAKLVPFLKHADIGLAPYRAAPHAGYLSQSSLKMVQYTYCNLPIVAPNFAAKGRSHVLSYDPTNIEGTIADAFERAIAYDRTIIDRSSVLDWEEFLDKMMAAA